MPGIKIAKAIGANTDLLTAQAFIFNQEGALGGGLKFAYLISAAGDEAFTRVRQAALELQEKAPGQDSPALALPELALFLNQQLQGLEGVQFILAVFKEGLVYLLTSGDHRAYLQRGSSLSDLTESGQSGQMVSGHLQPADRLLLLSPRSIGQPAAAGGWDAALVNRLLNAPPDNLEEEIGGFLQQLPNPEPIAAVLAVSQPVIASSSEDAILAVETDRPVKSKLQATLRLLIQRKRLLLAVLAVVGLMAVGITGWSVYRGKKSAEEGEFLMFYNSARDKLKQYQSLREPNSEEAKKLLEEAKVNLSYAEALKQADSRIGSLKQEMEQKVSEAGVYKVGDWPLFLSLDLIKEGFSTRRMSLSLGRALMLDDSRGTLVSLDLAAKNPQILAGSAQLGEALWAGINGDYAFVFSENKGVVRVDIPSGKAQQIIRPDKEWGKIIDIYGFANNVYLVDADKNQIWKYVPIVSGYSDKFKYFKAEQDLSSAKRIQIDSAVWVLKEGQQLGKFTSGAADQFSLSGLGQPLDNPASFFVSDQTENIYILDAANSRLVVVKKDGSYLSQYQGDKFQTADDLVVDEKAKKLYLLEGNNIYQVGL